LQRTRAANPTASDSYSSDEVRDELLMARYQRGDRAAMESLVKRHKVRIYNFVLRQVRHRETAADISQDVFLRVAQKASEFKHEARFSTWLYTIARNLCIDHQRKQTHRRHPSLDQEMSHEGGSATLGELMADHHPRSSVERSASATQVRQSILRAVDELPPEQKEVFLLREIGNLPFKEIAEVTATGENTVKSRMRYALERLQKALSDFEEYARELK